MNNKTLRNGMRDKSRCHEAQQAEISTGKVVPLIHVHTNPCQVKQMNYHWIMGILAITDKTDDLRPSFENFLLGK